MPGDIDDDVAIVVIRTAGDELAVEERTFTAEPIMVSEARRMAADAFATWGMLDEQAELACLLVSEVVTNVVLHATATPAPRREMVVPVAAGPPGRGGEPLSAPPPVQFNTDFGAALDGEGAFDGADFNGADFNEDDWNLGADLGRREPPTKEFRLRLRRGADMVWVEVFDSDMRLPRIRSAGETDEGGRGLYLVDQLATRWGARPTSDGKAVWFELPLTP